MAEGIDDEQVRARLDAERDRVAGLIEGLRSETGDEAGPGGGELAHYDQHPADAGSDTLEREIDLSILESLEVELAEVEAALERLDAGRYGIDEATGDPIDPARLEAYPTARQNVDPDPGRS